MVTDFPHRAIRCPGRNEDVPGRFKRHVTGSVVRSVYATPDNDAYQPDILFPVRRTLPFFLQ